ncbi:MAG: RluA family pseudouridine synthase [Bacillota bacterium]
MKRIEFYELSRKSSLMDYLAEELEYSARQAKKLIKENRIYINGKKAYRDSVLKKGDTVEIDMAESSNPDIIPQDIPLDIIYEDDSLLAINKPPFMVVHPTKGTAENTLANAVAYHFMKNNDKSAVRFLNRLDMNTSGIVVIPKGAKTHSLLMAQMEQNAISKKYTAVVEGSIEADSGRIELPLARDVKNPIKMCVSVGGLCSATLYKTINRYNGYSVLELELLTGRTHQIRVHLSHMGHPIVGDELYGSSCKLINRQALHAVSMEFKHPFSGKTIKLAASIPEDMVTLMRIIGNTAERQ